MFKWLHHLLNPHCEHCLEQARDAQICQSCEILKIQLEIVNYDKKRLLEIILSSNQPKSEPVQEQVIHEPIRPGHTPWAVKKEMLESADRKQAELMREYQKTVDELKKNIEPDPEIEALEEELGVKEDANEKV